MNWTAVAVFVSIGLAQAAFTVTLLDRLFKAETALLRQAIENLQKALGKREESEAQHLTRIEALEGKVARIEIKLEDCLRDPRC